jgi:hypothetical protein
MKIIGQALAQNLIVLFDQYNLRNKIIAYVKDEISNLNVMIITLKSIVSCEVMVVKENLKGLVLVMHFSKLVNMLQLIKKCANASNICP